ncbi:hypothetical protein [Belnapia rosea]|uniref:hypothetical protein n=1 Tax=Belnapia rosea TaxID=938405 RepID=UPI001FE07A80|nr:hypothetical protein [Belnapia rosea]
MSMALVPDPVVVAASRAVLVPVPPVVTVSVLLAAHGAVSAMVRLGGPVLV